MSRWVVSCISVVEPCLVLFRYVSSELKASSPDAGLCIRPAIGITTIRRPLRRIRTSIFSIEALSLCERRIEQEPVGIIQVRIDETLHRVDFTKRCFAGIGVNQMNFINVSVGNVTGRIVVPTNNSGVHAIAFGDIENGLLPKFFAGVRDRRYTTNSRPDWGPVVSSMTLAGREFATREKRPLPTVVVNRRIPILRPILGAIHAHFRNTMHCRRHFWIATEFLSVNQELK